MMTLKRSRARWVGAVLFLAALGVVGLYAAPTEAQSPSRDLAKRGNREAFCPFFSGPSCTHTFTGLELSGGALYTGGYYVTDGTGFGRWGAQVDVGVTFYGAFTAVMGGDLLRSSDGVWSGAFFIGARTALITFPWAILKALK